MDIALLMGLARLRHAAMNRRSALCWTMHGKRGPLFSAIVDRRVFGLPMGDYCFPISMRHYLQGYSSPLSYHPLATHSALLISKAFGV